MATLAILPSISMCRGLGSAQHDKKNAATTIGYWIEAVIMGNTLASPVRCPDRITDRNVNVPAATLKEEVCLESSHMAGAMVHIS